MKIDGSSENNLPISISKRYLTLLDRKKDGSSRKEGQNLRTKSNINTPLMKKDGTSTYKEHLSTAKSNIITPNMKMDRKMKAFYLYSIYNEGIGIKTSIVNKKCINSIDLRGVEVLYCLSYNRYYMQNSLGFLVTHTQTGDQNIFYMKSRTSYISYFYDYMLFDYVIFYTKRLNSVICSHTNQTNKYPFLKSLR